MKNFFKLFLQTIILGNVSVATGQSLSGYQYNGSFNPEQNTVVNKTQFNGYTDHWHDEYKKWIRYGNLFKISVPDIDKTITQTKIDIAEEIKIPGLWLQEGLINELLSAKYTILENPSSVQLEQSITGENVLVFIDSTYSVAQSLTDKLPKDTAWGEKLKSHQYNAEGFKKTNAFYLEKEKWSKC